MDAAEVQDKLKNVINSLIKGDTETSAAELHDVLVAKVRSRINPDEDAPAEPEVEDTDTDPDLTAAPPADEPAE